MHLRPVTKARRKATRSQLRPYALAAIGVAILAAGCGDWLLKRQSSSAKWIEATSLAATFPCNFRSIDAAGFSLGRLADEIDSDPSSPLLLRQAIAGWSGAVAWRDRSEFLRRHGEVSVGVGVGFRMSTRMNEDGLFWSWVGKGRRCR